MKKDYSKLDKEELIKIIEKLESHKRYGLIWDEEKVKEQFEKDSENAIPVLKEKKSKEIINKNGPVNIFIEGDNYHALSVLNFTHQSKIDVIYIDPPYNTGNKTWRYNNSFVESEDSFKHSKWISFMSKRLKLAKSLLKDDGIMVVAIDDYEAATLRLLLDEIFGEENRLGTCVVIHNPGGRQDHKFFPIAHEYMYFYAKNSQLASIGHLEMSEEKKEQYKYSDSYGRYKLREYRRSGANSRRQDGPGLWYPIYLDTENNNLSLESKGKNCIELWPIDNRGVQRCWRWGKDTFIEKKDKYIELKKKNNQYQLFVKEREDDNSGERPKTFWNKPKYSAVNGTNLLKDIFNNTEDKIFDYPKSPYLMLDILKITAKKKDSLVLDFFAGSGTTGQAVLELNKIDQGKRSFILCTNNEDNRGEGFGVAENVCYPRLKKIIEGYKDLKNKKIDGIKSNLKYFETKFVKNNLNNDDFKLQITKQCTEMLCLREGIFNETKKTDDYRIFQQNDRILAIYYSLDRKALSILKEELDNIDGDKIFYCFTLDPIGLDKNDFIGWSSVSLEPIPQKILDVYKQIYEY